MQQKNTIIDILTMDHGQVLKRVFSFAAILEKKLGKVWNLKRL